MIWPSFFFWGGGFNNESYIYDVLIFYFIPISAIYFNRLSRLSIESSVSPIVDRGVAKALVVEPPPSPLGLSSLTLPVDF